MPVINVVAYSGVTSVTVNIVVHNSPSVETSKLLGMYSRLDPRLQPLAIALRYWAKVVKSIILSEFDVLQLWRSVSYYTGCPVYHHRLP